MVWLEPAPDNLKIVLVFPILPWATETFFDPLSGHSIIFRSIAFHYTNPPSPHSFVLDFLNVCIVDYTRLVIQAIIAIASLTRFLESADKASSSPMRYAAARESVSLLSLKAAEEVSITASIA